MSNVNYAMERVKIVWQVALLKARSKERTNADATAFEETENGRVMVKWKDCLYFSLNELFRS